MNKKYIIIIVIFIITIIGIIFIINNRNKKIQNEKLNIKDKVSVDNIDNVENKPSKNVEIDIKEGTLTRTGTTIIISDSNNIHYNYDEWFRIDKKMVTNGNKWEEAVKITDSYSWIEILYKTKENGKLEMKVDWSNLYGELEDGQYRLVKRQYDNEYKYFSVEFNIK